MTVVSASKLSRSNFKGSPSRRQQSSLIDGRLDECHDNSNLQTFVEVELEELTRRTSVRHGSSPKWDSTFNMSLHDNKGILRFNLYECNPGSVKYDFLTSCEIKVLASANFGLRYWFTTVNNVKIFLKKTNALFCPMSRLDMWQMVPQCFGQ